MDALTFAGLIQSSGDKAYNFAYRLAGNEPDARDLVQEAFAKAFEHGDSYDPARPFDSWLFRILHNVFLDSVRRHSHTRTVSLDAPAPVEDAGWADLLPEDSSLPGDEMVKQESLDLLQRALERLPVTYKASVTLCDIEGLSYEDISQVMGIPVGTVRSRIHQGRVLLRKAYELSAFLDGALSAEGRVRVDAHVTSCPACRSELDSLRHMKLVLQSAPRKSLPADLALALERRLVHSSPWWAVLPRPALWVPAGTMAAAALLVGFWFHSTRTSEEIPLEALLEAHARYSAETLVPEENLVASNYSDQLTSLYADSSDTEPE